MTAGSLGRAAWTLAAVCAATTGGIAYIHRGQRLEREVRPSCSAVRCQLRAPTPGCCRHNVPPAFRQP